MTCNVKNENGIFLKHYFGNKRRFVQSLWYSPIPYCDIYIGLDYALVILCQTGKWGGVRSPTTQSSETCLNRGSRCGAEHSLSSLDAPHCMSKWVGNGWLQLQMAQLSWCRDILIGCWYRSATNCCPTGEKCPRGCLWGMMPPGLLPGGAIYSQSTYSPSSHSRHHLGSGV